MADAGLCGIWSTGENRLVQPALDAPPEAGALGAAMNSNDGRAGTTAAVLPRPNPARLSATLRGLVVVADDSPRLVARCRVGDSGSLLMHAACPRYEYIVLGPENADVIRHDRWTGDNEHMWIIGRGPNSLTDPRPFR